MVNEALLAQEKLQEEGINARVINSLKRRKGCINYSCGNYGK
ncbi:hypothetical protein [Clostridioides difficile]